MTARHPWFVILMIVLISVSAVAAMVLRPMPTQFEMQDWLPVVDEVTTWTTYEESFTPSYYFTVLLKGNGGDVVTRNGFLDMMELSSEIAENDTFQRWKDEGAPGDNPAVPPLSMYSMEKAMSSARTITKIDQGLSSVLGDVMDLNGTSSIPDEGRDPGNSTWLRSVLEPLRASVEKFHSSAGEVDISPIQVAPDAESYISGFESDDELKERVSELFEFDPGSESLMGSVQGLMNFSSEAGKTIGSMQQARSVLVSLRDDPDLYNGTMDVSLGGDTVYVNAYDHIDMLISSTDDAIDRLSMFLSMSSAYGNPLIVGGIASDLNMASYTMEFFFTKDFEPRSGGVSADACIMMVYLDPSFNSNDDATKELLRNVEIDLTEACQSYGGDGSLSIRPLGNVLINDRINEASQDSMMILLPGAFVLIVIILGIIYRNVTDVLLSLSGLSLAILWMFGFGSLMQFSNNPMITAVPVLIVGLGIDYGIHLTLRYREEMYKGAKVKEALRGMTGSVGIALLLATLTTVVAFMSNISSPIGLIMQFGVMAAVGILSSFMIMILLIPSVKVLIDGRKARKGKPLFGGFKEGDVKDISKSRSPVYFFSKGLASASVGAERHPVLVLALIALLTLGLGAAASQNELSFSVNDFLPEGLQEAEDLKYLLSEFKLAGGSGDIAVILIEGDITQPDVLRAMQETTSLISALNSSYVAVRREGTTTTASVDHLLPTLRDLALNLALMDPVNDLFLSYNRAFDTRTGLPLDDATPEMVRDTLTIFETGFPMLSRRVIHSTDGEFDMALISVVVSTKDDNEAGSLLRQLERTVGPLKDLVGDGIDTVSISGSSILMSIITTSINESQIRSLIITLAISLAVLTIVFFLERRSILLGTVATLPMVLCVIWILGAMYLLGLPLNAMTITIGSLTVGLGITYGIHITHRFLEDLGRECDVHEACRSTLMNTGSALLGAAVTTVSGFSLLLLALMPPLKQFGAVTALTIVFSFISSVLVLPVLLVIWARSRNRYRKWKECRTQDSVQVK
ncbi:MAG: MMPL family transporter [Candidatus Thermoplasmatota archaeon]|nr:MMPL family transporter [Candidatus Thermoplasmatota archaeon]